MADSKGKSPYNRYNKKPTRYSQLYQDWKAARNSNNNQLARELGYKHTSHFLGLPLHKAAA